MQEHSVAEINIGDVMECAIWLTGTETDGHLTRWKEIDCPNSLRKEANGREVLVGPITFTEKRPGEERVPQVPGHISGPDVRLLVAEAVVVGFRSIGGGSSFLLDLEPRDLEKLRTITRRAHRKANPGEELSDAGCDYIINQIGPEAAMKAVRAAVDGKALH
jgi:hypothetical protein